MSEEKNKSIIRRFYQELDKHNFDIYDELCTEDYISHFPGSPEPQDRATRKQTSRSFYAAIPDGVDTLEDIIAVGDRVAARGSGRSTHTGPFGEFPPTGSKIQFTGMRLYRIVDCKIAEEWSNLDLLGVLPQLGALPLPGEGDRQAS